MLRRMKKILKKILPVTLLGRSLLILVTPIFLVQIITTVIFFDRHWQKMGDRMAYALAGEIALMADQIEEDDSADHLLQLQKQAARSLNLFLQYERGRQFSTEGRYKTRELEDLIRGNVIVRTLDQSFQGHLHRPYSIRLDRDEKWVEVTVGLDKGTLLVTMPERRIFSSSGYIVLLWMVGSSIVLLIIATLFMRNQIRPIRRLAIAAERFGKGRDVPFFKVEGAREVRQAASAFIEMKSRLARQIHQRTAMLAGVSHDLRTPLTRMKLQLSMMGEGEDVSDLRNDIADMERMIEAYLLFARGQGGEEPVRTNLHEIVMQQAEAMNREEEKIFVDVAPDLNILLRPVAFGRCLGNLLGNGLKYGGHVWVSAEKIDNMIEIRIDDDGPGIPENQYEDVFKPFFRGESSRNSKTGGVGLGLPIVQDIVLSHGGQIWLDKSPKGGLRVIIDLPV